MLLGEREDAVVQGAGSLRGELSELGGLFFGEEGAVYVLPDF